MTKDSSATQLDQDQTLPNTSPSPSLPHSIMGYYGSYYSYGLPTFFIVVIALYLLFTGAYQQLKLG
jgi:hypothetical protein